MKLQFWSLEGNRQWLDGGSMYGNAPRPVWEKWSPPDDLGRIELACRSLLVKFNNQLILCEAGIGAFFDPHMAKRYGVESSDRHLLIESLEKIGYETKDIDYVILSHLHFDHAGGLLPTFNEIQKSGYRIIFEKAQIIVGEEAWKRALNPHSRDRASYIPELTALLQKSSQLRIISKSNSFILEKSLSDIISWTWSDGHTPGQMLTEIKTPRSSVTFCGDLIPGIPWMHIPITMGYDRNPELLIDEKIKLYSHRTPKNSWFFFTHDPRFCASQFSQNEKGRIESFQAESQWIQKELD